VLSGRGLCDELITRPEESYRLCCVVVCHLETSRMGAPYIHDISRLRVNEVRKIYRSILCLREISGFHTVDFEVSGVLDFTPNSLVLIPGFWNSLGI